jgi:hypothetical protein
MPVHPKVDFGSTYPNFFVLQLRVPLAAQSLLSSPLIHRHPERQRDTWSFYLYPFLQPIALLLHYLQSTWGHFLYHGRNLPALCLRPRLRPSRSFRRTINRPWLARRPIHAAFTRRLICIDWVPKSTRFRRVPPPIAHDPTARPNQRSRGVSSGLATPSSWLPYNRPIFLTSTQR